MDARRAQAKSFAHSTPASMSIHPRAPIKIRTPLRSWRRSRSSRTRLPSSQLAPCSPSRFRTRGKGSAMILAHLHSDGAAPSPNFDGDIVAALAQSFRACDMRVDAVGRDSERARGAKERQSTWYRTALYYSPFARWFADHPRTRRCR